MRFWFHDTPDVLVLLLHGEDATVPERAQRRFAGGEELLRLSPAAPPHDLRLDRIELAEGPVEVKGVQLVGRHAIGQQGHLEHAGRRPLVEGPLARKRLEIEEVRPRARRLAGAERVLVVTDDERVVEAAHVVRTHEARIDLAFLDDRIVDGLQQPLLGGGHREVALDIDDVPIDVAALDHRLELPVVCRSVDLHHRSGHLLERLHPGFHLGVLRGAAPGGEHHLLRLETRGGEKADKTEETPRSAICCLHVILLDEPMPRRVQINGIPIR